MDRDVAGGAVAVPRAQEVVERWRLRPEGAAGDGAVALEAELVDPGPFESHGVGRPVRLVAAHARPADIRDVRVDERSAFLGMAGDTCRGARTVDHEALLALTTVRVVARDALHAATVEFVSEGLVERAILGWVAAGAQRVGRPHQLHRLRCTGGVNRMTRIAVHAAVGMNRPV